MTLTIENLQAEGACEPGMTWITPIIENAPDTVADRLCVEHPLWHQWAVVKGFDVPVSPDVWERMGCVIVGGRLRHVQTAGDDSTQTAGDDSTQTAGDDSTQKAGEGSTQKAGVYSTQTAGYHSTQTAGVHSTQTAGDGSTQTAGNLSVQTAGICSTQKAGDDSTQTVGHRSTQKAGDDSTQTAGNCSTQTAGWDSTQTAGNYSTQTAGGGSRHKAGPGSVFVCRYYDGGRSVSAVALTDDLDTEHYWTYDLDSKTWVQAEDQSDPSEVSK